MQNDTLEKIALAGAVISILLFSLILGYSGISSGSAVNIQNSLIMAFLASSPIDFLTPLIFGILSFVFLAMFFAFLSAYGYFSDDRRTGLIAGIAGALITIVIFHSITSIFLAIGLLLSSVYVVPLANTYSKELKRWIRFRVGSNAIGKALMIMNVAIALGVFLSISINAQYYQDSFQSELRTTMRDAIGAQTSSLTASQLPAAQQAILQQQLDAQIDQQIEKALSTPFFVAYFRWLPAIAALSVWIILEFLRNILLSNVGGVFTSVLIHACGKKK
jgi:hypothetical protein